jgi:hypothetical protein
MVGLVAAGLAAGYVFNNWQHQQKLDALKTSDGNEASISHIRPLFKLKDLQGKVQTYSGQCNGH